MKTLKKTLCLVLAVVMAVGVLVLPANAAYGDLTDTDKIGDDFKLAVEALTNMGIVSGVSTTTFGPDTYLLRQQAAVLLVNVMMNENQRKTDLAGYPDAFADLGGTDIYAKPQINYLAAKGIVSGKDKDAGLFKPSDTLTTYELLTMLRKVAEIKNGYVSGTDEWTVEAMKFGVAYGAFTKGLEDLFDEPDQTPTRAQAAQIIWNVITHKGSSSVTGTYTVTLKDGTKFQNVDLEQALMLKLTYPDAEVKPDNAGGNTIGGVVYGLHQSTSKDIYGRISDTWVSKDEKTVYVSTSRQLVAEFNDYFTTKDLQKALGVADGKTIRITNYWLNGALAEVDGATPHIDTNPTYWEITPKATDYLGGAGTLTQVYKNGDYYEMVGVETFAVKLAAADVVPAKGTTAAYIVLEKGADGKATLTFNTTAYKANDVVIYTKGVDSDGKLKADVFTPEVKTGYVTATNTDLGYFRIDNEVYYPSENLDENTNFGTMMASKKAYDFYFDAYQNVIFVEENNGTTAHAVYDGYVYVVNYAAQGESSTILGTSLNAMARAEIIDFATGDHKTVDIAIVKDNNVWYYKNALGDKGTDTVVNVNEKNNEKYIGICQYKKFDDGTYCIQAPADGVTGFSLTAGSAKVGGVNEKFANSKTVLNILTVTKTGGSIDTTKAISRSTAVGYNAFPTATTGTVISACVVVSATASNVINEIYVIKTAESQSSTIKFAVYAGKGETDVNGTKLSFVIDGTVVTYYDTATPGEYNVGDVYQLSVTNGKLDKQGDPIPEGNHSKLTSVKKVDTNLYSVGSQVYELSATARFYKVVSGTLVEATEADIKDGDTLDIYKQSTEGAKYELVVFSTPAA